MPGRIGSKMLVTEDKHLVGTIGGGSVEHKAVNDALKLLAVNVCKVIEYDISDRDSSKLGMVCGGMMELFFEVVSSLPKLFIFGAGHISVPLVTITGLLGFRITVIDDRKELLIDDRYSCSVDFIYTDFNDYIDRIYFDNNSYIVIITHGHKYDEKVLRYSIKKPFKYIGMIGSREKVKTIMKNLKQEGYSEELLNKVYTPIGLNIGWNKPEEIALAISAELMAVKNNLKEVKSCRE